MAIPKPSESWEVVSIFDPAIDRESTQGKTAFVKYRRERDLAELVLLPGRTPALFVLRPVNTRCVMRYLKTAQYQADVWERGFRATVIAIRSYRGVAGDEHPADVVPERYAQAVQHATDTETFNLWTDEEFDKIHPSVVEEIGDVAQARASFHPTIWPRFVLLPSSAQMLGTQELRAEQELASRKETSSDSGAAPAPTTEP